MLRLMNESLGRAKTAILIEPEMDTRGNVS
jgi:hypothetical protein